MEPDLGVFWFVVPEAFRVYEDDFLLIAFYQPQNKVRIETTVNEDTNGNPPEK